jgi:hypothetical protein
VKGVGDSKLKFKYIIIAIIIVLLILYILFFLNNDLNVAFINDEFLDNEWYENLEYREINSKLFGLENWVSLRYETDKIYKCYLTITTIKSLFLLDENELHYKINEEIESIFENGVEIDKNSKISGERFLKNGHKSLFSIYDGFDNTKNSSEKIKVIIEVWNCGIEGKSIICMGYSQLSDNYHKNSDINTIYWEKIVGDMKGTFGIDNFIRNDALIYNVICH